MSSTLNKGGTLACFFTFLFAFFHSRHVLRDMYSRFWVTAPDDKDGDCGTEKSWMRLRGAELSCLDRVGKSENPIPLLLGLVSCDISSAVGT